MPKVLLIFVALLFVVQLFAQQRLVDAELSLERKLNALREAKDAEEIKKLNQAFKTELESVFSIDGFFDYPFSKLRTLGSIKSPDNQLRLFNWNIEHADQTHSYYCYIAHYHNNKLLITELKDNSFMLPPRPDETLDHDNWYGALYYQIIPVKKKNKQLYTLIGWDGNSSFSDMKVIDILYFTGSKPKLGYPVFKDNEGVKRRMFYEFKKNTVMTLRYEQNRSMIVLDHLSPESPSLVGVYAYYVPDMSYDCFKWNGTYWMHEADIIVLNAEDKRKKTVIKDAQGKTIKVIENEWIDPTESNSPIDNGKHVAVKPDTEEKNDKRKKTEEVKTQPVHPNYRKGKRKKNKPGSAIKIQR